MPISWKSCSKRYLFSVSSCSRPFSGCKFVCESVVLQLQLKLCKGISYAAVAAHADKSGRRKLAAMLIEHEPRSSKQVSSVFSLSTFKKYV